MKKLLFIILLQAFLLSDGVVLPESTVAVVNGMALSEDELDKEVGKLMPKSYYHATLNDKKLKTLKKKALVSLINMALLYQYALSKDLDVNEEELQAVMDKLIRTFGSEAKFRTAIKHLGFTDESFIKAVKKDEVLKKLYKAELKISYSENELKAYYEKNKFKFKEPEKIRVRLIYVRNNPEDPNGKSKSRKQIDEAFTKIKAGEDFGDVASKYSTDMSRIKGGDMGYLHRGRLDEAVEEKAFSMNSGEVSEIIEKDIGFFIVKVEDKKISNQLSFETVKKSLEKDLKKKVEEKRKAKLLKELKRVAVIISSND